MTTDPARHHHRRQQADGSAHRLHPRRTDRRALQELLHRSGTGRSRHQARAQRGARSPITNSPRAPGTARKPWSPTTPPPSTIATASCRACSPPRATSPSASASSRRSAGKQRRAGKSQSRGGKGQPREVGFPFQHEPRAPLAAQRHPRFRAAHDFRYAAAHTPPRSASIDPILHAGWYLLDLINEILDLAQIESGKLALSLEPTSLAEVMCECQAMIEPQGQKRGIGMTFPQLRHALLCGCRPHPAEAGAHQPSFERHQVQPGRTERSRGGMCVRQRPGTRPHQRQGHRRGPASRDAGAALSVVQPARAARPARKKARASAW